MEIETNKLPRATLESLVHAHQRAFGRVKDAHDVIIDGFSKLIDSQTPVSGNDLIAILNEWTAAFTGTIEQSVTEISEILEERDQNEFLN